MRQILKLSALNNAHTPEATMKINRVVNSLRKEQSNLDPYWLLRMYFGLGV